MGKTKQVVIGETGEKKQESEKTKKPAVLSVKPRSKKYQQALKKIDRGKKYPLLEAIKLAQAVSYTKFPASLEAHLNTNFKNLRGLVSLPHFTGSQLKILVFGDGAKEAGADLVGSEETLEEIAKGKINFDVVVATPPWMPKLAKVAKILGPKGLMPNPKNETITTNLAKTVANLKGGKIEYKTESNGQVIHLAVGKVSQPAEEITANLKVLLNHLGRSKVIKLTIAPTMGPGVKVDLASI